ncbi:MAG: PDC sensor domain-containing protein [Thiotrichaceae bacterium]
MTTSNPSSIKESVIQQRNGLKKLLGNSLTQFSQDLAALMDDPSGLNEYLRQTFDTLLFYKYVYVLDVEGVQISATIFNEGMNIVDTGRDRSQRPYMKKFLIETANQEGSEALDCDLSEAYISLNRKRPSITAIQVIRDENKKVLGFLGVDYDLRELPPADEIYEEPRQYRQIKGDPSIRDGLFLQQRVESEMDAQLDSVMAILEELMIEHGVYHCQIHYSSSRVTVWHVDDPFVYRILTMDELSDMSICLAYPRRAYFERSIVPKEDIMKIFKQFSALRFADRTIYLRSGSLNLVNGFIGLNFSCDGTHYLIHDEFLKKGMNFWFGTGDVEDDRQLYLDDVLENLAQSGCKDVNKVISLLDQGEVPTELSDLDEEERSYIHKELKDVMAVYDGEVCSI